MLTKDTDQPRRANVGPESGNVKPDNTLDLREGRLCHRAMGLSVEQRR